MLAIEWDPDFLQRNGIDPANGEDDKENQPTDMNAMATQGVPATKRAPRHRKRLKNKAVQK